MAPQTYELSFILSIVVIFVCLVLFIIAINLFVSIIRFTFRQITKLFTRQAVPEDQKESESSDDKVPISEESSNNKISTNQTDDAVVQKDVTDANDLSSNVSKRKGKGKAKKKV